MALTLTDEGIEGMGFPAGSVSASDSLAFNAALEWLMENTDFGNLETEEEVAALPSGAKVFILRFIGELGEGSLSGGNIAGESIGGMSKTYQSAADSSASFLALALQLLGSHYLGGRIRTAQDCGRWMYGRVAYGKIRQDGEGTGGA